MKKRIAAVSQSKSTKIHLLFTLLYIAVIYIPFMILVIASPYNVLNTSLSSIAWRHDGLAYIILYGVLTIPFLWYEISFYLKNDKRRKNALVWPLMAGCLLLGVGIIFPCRGGDFSTQLHCLFSQAGAVVLILAITGIIIRFCKNVIQNKKSIIVKISVFYGALIAFIGISFIGIGAIAIVEVGSSFIYMIILFSINFTLAEKSLGTQDNDSVQANTRDEWSIVENYCCSRAI